MIHYVGGFLFDTNQRYILLIEKNKPEWMKGLYNGVGGRIEEGESSLQAMVREFKEETDLDVEHWNPYCTMVGDNDGGWDVEWFWAVLPEQILRKARTAMKEEVRVTTVAAVMASEIPLMANLPWLVSMAIVNIFGKDRCSHHVVHEEGVVQDDQETSEHETTTGS